MLLMHVGASLVQMWCSGAPPFKPAPCPRNTSSSPNPHLQSHLEIGIAGHPALLPGTQGGCSPKGASTTGSPLPLPPAGWRHGAGTLLELGAWELPPPFLSSSPHTSQTGSTAAPWGLGTPPAEGTRTDLLQSPGGFRPSSGINQGARCKQHCLAEGLSPAPALFTQCHSGALHDATKPLKTRLRFHLEVSA